MPSETQSPLLVIMAKAPRPGEVKTRLAVRLPWPGILELYRCLLGDTISLAQSLQGIETVVMSPAGDVEELHRVVDHGVRVVAQIGEGLGAALTSVFAHFAAAGPRRIVAFNSDSPHLPPSALLSAFEALRSCDLVVGPTLDGGYYLIGATASHAGLFLENFMGTGSAFEALLWRISSLKLTVGFTDPFYDIDVPDDLNRLAAELRLAPERAPRTANWLTEWARTAAQSSGGGRDT
jgi:rSAM/selenodomain-associated transferase 1